MFAGWNHVARATTSKLFCLLLLPTSLIRTPYDEAPLAGQNWYHLQLWRVQSAPSPLIGFVALPVTQHIPGELWETETHLDDKNTSRPTIN